LIGIAAIVSSLRNCAAEPCRQARSLARWAQASAFDQTTGVKIAQFQAEPSKADTSTISPLI
jgi:hypothetical protein